MTHQALEHNGATKRAIMRISSLLLWKAMCERNDHLPSPDEAAEHSEELNRPTLARASASGLGNSKSETRSPSAK